MIVAVSRLAHEHGDELLALDLNPVIVSADGAVAVDVLIVPRAEEPTPCHGLTEQDLDIRRRAREFIDTLVPYEVEAELAGGVLPAELTEKFHHAALDSGLYATNMPESVGGRASPRSSRCWCRSRSAASPTVCRGACTRRRSGGSTSRPTEQLDRWLRPAVAGIATSATRSPRSSLAATSATWRHGAVRELGRGNYVVNGTKWHVTSYNLADYCFVQAVLSGRTERRRARAPGRRPAEPGHRGRAHAGVLPQHRRPPPDRVVHRRAHLRPRS